MGIMLYTKYQMHILNNKHRISEHEVIPDNHHRGKDIIEEVEFQVGLGE